MTKFETLLKLSEIKGALMVADNMAQIGEIIGEIHELIDDLSTFFQPDDECQTTAGNCGYCGGFHD